ncbi:MAG: 4-alpha-glucanotransferase [Gammaproteobacteria bacterium]|nr:4-alpha-glucanotransferase [Gammaproteobacteria bacterium]
MSRARHGDWFERRRAGILLPLSALAVPSDGGGLGDPARRFLQFLSDTGFRIWQLLPVQPVDAHSSPYQGCSAFAGHPGLISSQRLAQTAWFGGEGGGAALAAFNARAGTEDRAGFAAFREQSRYWLNDYALFMAIRDVCGNQPWWNWPDGLRDRKAGALAAFHSDHADAIERWCFAQFLFSCQWNEMRSIAKALGILLFGDMPLFVAHDSADVWSHSEYFQLDARGQPTVVAGVPPDYFSSTGQRWGNPVYHWGRLREQGFQWWVERMHRQLQLFDIVRIDHFRGLEALWEIPADCPTAQRGEWRPVPGEALLRTLRKSLGPLPCIAEDLGIITPPVEKLRKKFRLPGVKVLQFAFDGDASNPYLPHNLEPEAVVYTGTHDNNTTVGWYEALDTGQKMKVMDYLRQPPEPMPWPLINAALGSVCRFAILPMQDLLVLGAAHRTNTPGTVDGNWKYCLDWNLIRPELGGWLRHLNGLYGRC